MIHPTASIGEPPQDRRCHPTDGVYFPPVLAESARIGAYAVIDAGVSRETFVGPGAWVMCQAHVAHDCIVSEHVEIAPHATLLGYVTVGANSKIGGGAVILPFRTIGRDCTIGAGAVVTKDVPDGETWAGNPARRIDPNPTPFTQRGSLADVAYLEHFEHARQGL